MEPLKPPNKLTEQQEENNYTILINKIWCPSMMVCAKPSSSASGTCCRSPSSLLSRRKSKPDYPYPSTFSTKHHLSQTNPNPTQPQPNQPHPTNQPTHSQAKPENPLGHPTSRNSRISRKILAPFLNSNETVDRGSIGLMQSYHSVVVDEKTDHVLHSLRLKKKQLSKEANLHQASWAR